MVRQVGTGSMVDTDGWSTQHPFQTSFPCLSTVEAEKLKKKISHLPTPLCSWDWSQNMVLEDDIIRNLLEISGKAFATFLLPGIQMWLITQGAAAAILWSWGKYQDRNINLMLLNKLTNCSLLDLWLWTTTTKLKSSFIAYVTGMWVFCCSHMQAIADIRTFIFVPFSLTFSSACL